MALTAGASGTAPNDIGKPRAMEQKQTASEAGTVPNDIGNPLLVEQKSMAAEVENRTLSHADYTPPHPTPSARRTAQKNKTDHRRRREP